MQLIKISKTVSWGYDSLADNGENNDMIEYFIQNIQMLAETDTNFHENIVWKIVILGYHPD